MQWLAVCHRCNATCRKPLSAFGVGVLANALTQSSDAISTLLIGLVNTQLVELPVAVIMLLGANVGSTLVVQLFAFHITGYKAVLIGPEAAHRADQLILPRSQSY